jgi:hypothetical protein
LPRTAAHPFYEPLNRGLEERGFDEFVEQQCVRFYAERMERPGLAPGRYFRRLLVGYFGVALISFGVITTGVTFCIAAQDVKHATEIVATAEPFPLAAERTPRTFDRAITTF